MRDKVAEAMFKLALKQAESEKVLLIKDVQINRQTLYIQWFIVGGTGVVLILTIILMIVVIRNSKKQKLLNESLDIKNKQLQELNVTKDKFITIIAHDLKSPFNALLGFLTELDENYLDYDEKTRHDIIHKLKKSSYSTFNLLINLLDWSQSQQGKFVSAPKDFRLDKVVEEVVTVLSNRAVHKKQTITTEFDDGLVVHSDPQMVKSILINLVNNAIKFTPTGGKIRVGAISDEKALHIAVEDTGIGIPKEEIGNLFRLDSRFNRKGTEQEPGTGLGLVMVHEYVTMLGGNIEVESEEGKGSKFVVTMPHKGRSS
jgi:signal transduction histidine kinase